MEIQSDVICEVVNAHKYFGAVQALAGVDMVVKRGEILGVVGPNGSGKTTLFSCMTGHFHLNRGQVKWLGQDITAWPMYRIARLGLLRTYQQSMYFASATVAENILMAVDIARTGKRAEHDISVPTDVEGLVDYVGLKSLADRHASELSHGNLRQLGIALTLAARPSLLLLDEPAAGLNDVEGHELGRLLRRIRDAGITLVVVDHDMGFVLPLVDRLVVLSVGLKLAEGSPSDVRNDPRVIEVYLGSRFEHASPAASAVHQRMKTTQELA